MLELTGKKSKITSRLHRQAKPYETDAFIDATSDSMLLAHIGVPMSLIHHAVGTYRRSEYPKMVVTWLEHLTEDIYRPQFDLDGIDPDLCGMGLALWGPVGSRKTTLAAAILLEVARMKVESIDPTGRNWGWAGAAMPKFLDWQDSCDLLRQAAGGDEEMQENARRLWIGSPDTTLDRGDILVIDDIGRERYSEFSANELHRMLRLRHGLALPTIITTNYAPDEWAGQHGDVLGSYMRRIFFDVEIKTS